MKLLFKDQAKKIRQNILQFISLSLLVIILSLSFTAVSSSVSRLKENYEPYLEHQKIEDFYFSIDQINMEYLSGTLFTDLCREMDALVECGIAVSLDTPDAYNDLNQFMNQRIKVDQDSYTSFIDQYLSYFEDEYDYIIEKQKIVNVFQDDHFFKFMNIHEVINIPYIIDGRAPIENNEVMIFDTYAEENNLIIGDTIVIEDIELTIVGFAYSPEFLFPIFSMNNISFEPSTQTLVFAKDELLDQLPYDVFIKYTVQGDLSKITELNTYQELQNQDKSVLGKYLQFVTVLLPKDLNYRIISLQMEIENAQLFINVFMFTFMIFITLLILLFVKRYISKYKKEIDILKSLGYNDQEITLSYLSFPLLISLCSIIGYVIGLILSNTFFEIYSERYLFNKAPFSLSLPILIVSVLLPILFITIFSYIFIKVEINTKPKVQKVKGKLFKFMTLRSILQFSILFLVINTILLFGLNGNDMFTEFVDVTSVGNNYEELITLRYFENATLEDGIESLTRIQSSVISVNNAELTSPISTMLYGVDPDLQQKALIDNDPLKNNLLTEGVIISDYLKETLNVVKGDIITFKIGNILYSETIVEVSNELIESNIYMLRDELNEAYGVDYGSYNAVFVPHSDFDHPHAITRINYTKGLQEFTSVLNISSMIIEFITTLSIILGVSIFTILIILYMSEHKKTIALLKAYGYSQKETIIKLVSPIIVILVSTYIISIPLTNFFLDLMLKSMMNIIGFKLILTINQVNVVIGFIFLVILLLVTIYFISRYNEKLSVSETLKSL